jgi:rhodanese-related sulfurtransferase
MSYCNFANPKSNKMNKYLFLLLFLPLAACSGNTENQVAQTEISTQEPVVKVVDVDGFEKAMKSDNILILDVRTDGEVAQGVIPGAMQIDFMNNAEFEEGIARLDKNKEILVYCKVGGRSAKAAAYMEEKGFKSVYDLKGGYDAWSAAGKQTEELKK